MDALWLGCFGYWLCCVQNCATVFNFRPCINSFWMWGSFRVLAWNKLGQKQRNGYCITRPYRSTGLPDAKKRRNVKAEIVCTDVREETADTQKASPVYAPVNSVGQRQRVGAASVETAKFETVLGSALALNLQATLLREQAYQFQFVYTSKTFLAFNPPYWMTYAKKKKKKNPPKK